MLNIAEFGYCEKTNAFRLHRFYSKMLLQI